MKRIAVWNTAFLGDAVLTLPLIQTLADAFPGSEIDFYVRRGLASLFEAHPALHAVYEYDKRPHLPGTIACPRCSRAGVSLAGGAMTSGSARIQAPVPRCGRLERRAVARGLYRGPRRGALLQPARIPPFFRAARDRTAS